MTLHLATLHLATLHLTTLHITTSHLAMHAPTPCCPCPIEDEGHRAIGPALGRSKGQDDHGISRGTI